MTIGSNYIYKCSECPNHLVRGSILSGNTLGAELFSDGRQFAPMLPEFPNLTKCTKCDTILWLNEMKEVGTYRTLEEKLPEWENAEYADFLSITDLFRALELDTVKNDNKKEKDVRIRIWWAFNDRIRGEYKNHFVQAEEESLWKQNCLRLIELLDITDTNQKIMTAELYRNLGEFDACMKLINSLNEKLYWVIDRFEAECNNKNILVVKMK